MNLILTLGPITHRICMIIQMLWRSLSPLFPPHIQDFENMGFQSLSRRILSRGFCFDERGPSNLERPGRIGCDTDHGKRVEDQTLLDDDTPLEKNSIQPMEAQQHNLDTQPNQIPGETTQHISAQSPFAAQNVNLNLTSPNRMVENQPTLNTIDQINTPPHDHDEPEPETSLLNLAHISSTLAPSNCTLNIRFSQTQTLSSSSSEYQTPNPNTQLPTRKRFRKEFGKLKRNLRQRLLCGFFHRESKGGSETEGLFLGDRG